MSTNKCNDKAISMQELLGQLVNQANQTSQFSRRNTPLNAVRFVQVLVLGWLKKGNASLNDLAEMASGLGINVTDSAIHDRMNSRAIELLSHVLCQALQVLPTGKRIPLSQLEQFSKICVTDSTQLKLPDTMYDLFAGPKGLAKIKLQVTVDYLSGDWIALDIESGKSPDQNSDLPLSQAVAGSLNLFDLGYFKQERLRDIVAQEAFFVSRLQSQTALYDIVDESRVELVGFLKSRQNDHIDIELKLGGRVKLPIRLVARRLPKAVADARRRKAKKKMRQNGKTCSAAYLAILAWDILITNLSATDWALSQIFDLYPIRTQIEWIFRVWKSQLQVHFFGKNWRTERVLCQLYAHLIGILLCHRLTAGWLWHHKHEHSFSKCVHIIRHRIERLILCVKRQWYGIHSWIHRLEDSFRQFGRKTKRKKEPSTFQILRKWSLS